MQRFLLGEPQLMLDDEGDDNAAGIDRSGPLVRREAFGADRDHPVP